MSKVYFKPIKSYSNTEEINEVSTFLLDTLIYLCHEYHKEL
ncbi:hypothetical protein [Clostridium sp.]